MLTHTGVERSGNFPWEFNLYMIHVSCSIQSIDTIPLGFKSLNIATVLKKSAIFGRLFPGSDELFAVHRLDALIWSSGGKALV